MTLKTDHSFHIGEQHLRTGKPCQDYALSGTDYAIVADGCSSGGMTDFGARLISLALKQAAVTGPLPGLVDRTQAYLDTMRRSLELDTRDMLATGLIAIAHSPEHVGVVVLGDGVIIEQAAHGTLYAYKYEWSDNAPFYLAYTQADRASFLARQPTLTCERWTIQGSDTWKHVRTTDQSVAMAIREGVNWSTGLIERGDKPPRAVGLFSDGVLQVDNLPWQKVVWELMSFKSTNGQFATRRMNRFLTDAKKIGRGPIDDIAMAVIHLGRDQET